MDRPRLSSSVSALGHGGRRLDVGDDMAAERVLLAVAVGGGSRGQRQLGGGGPGAGLAVAAEVVLALAPDEGVEPHHYDRRANQTVNHKGEKEFIS